MWPPLTVLPEETFCLKTTFANKALRCFCAQEKSLKPQHILANSPPSHLRHQEVLLMGREGMSEVLGFSLVLISFQIVSQYLGVSCFQSNGFLSARFTSDL